MVEISFYKTICYIWIRFKKGKNFYESSDQLDSDVIFLLPILENSYEEFAFKLIESMKKFDKVNLYESFPIRLIVDAALNSHSEYWIVLALNWLEKISDIKCYSDQISNIIDDKSYSQRTRHRALKLMSKTR